MLLLFNKWITFRRLLGEMGLYRAIIFTWCWLWKRFFFLVAGKCDVVDQYAFTRHAPFGNPERVPLDSDKSLNWVIPDFTIGAGGHLTIFRMISLLEKQGYRCNIIIDGPCQFPSAEKAKECVNQYYCPVDAPVMIGREAMNPAWGTFATSWQTAYTVRDFRATREKFYFVQDYEPFFYPQGSVYYFAERTYHFGFHGVTAGDWLAQKLKVEYGTRTSSFGFSFDRVPHKPTIRRDGPKRVFFYARPVTPRRGFELGLMVLNEVYHQYPNIEFVLVGQDVSDYQLDIPCVNAGVVAHEELPGFFSQCDVALVLSFTNLSLLPLELMAYGCPVVSNRGKNVEWFLNKSNAVLAEATVEDLSAAIVDLLNNSEKCKALSMAGLALAHATDWESEAKKVDSFMKEVRRGFK